jgi:hypothetical protein
MQFLVALFIFVMFASELRAEPINLREPIIQQSTPWIENVAKLTILRDRGYLPSIMASSQMYSSLDQAMRTLGASRYGASAHPRSVADVLENNSVWWSDGPDTGPRGGEPYPLTLYVHNRTDRMVSGVIVEVADKDCDFRRLGCQGVSHNYFRSGGCPAPKRCGDL